MVRSAGRRVGVTVAAVGLAAGIWLVAAAGTASADSVSFSCTGAAQTWTVPAGVTSATFDLFGAKGGGGTGSGVQQASGGLGGETTATIAVTPGETIQINVGCAGGSSATGHLNGGFGGGGGACTGGCNTAPVGAGGGASDVRQGGTALANRVLVAGGGGGASGVFEEAGGPGGAPTGTNGADGNVIESGGSGGTQSTGGAGGTGNPTPATDGQAGTLGVGGDGGAVLPACSVGGGGGGGYYGGGGGGEEGNVTCTLAGGGGGGGGSSFGPAGTTFQTGVRSGDGLVTITFTVTTPTTAPIVAKFTG